MSLLTVQLVQGWPMPPSSPLPQQVQPLSSAWPGQGWAMPPSPAQLVQSQAVLPYPAWPGWDWNTPPSLCGIGLHSPTTTGLDWDQD